MDITVYLPENIGKLAKEANLNLSQILRAGVLEALGMENPPVKPKTTVARLNALESAGEKDWDAFCRLAARVSKTEARLQALEESVTPTDSPFPRPVEYIGPQRIPVQFVEPSTYEQASPVEQAQMRADATNDEHHSFCLCPKCAVDPEERVEIVCGQCNVKLADHPAGNGLDECPGDFVEDEDDAMPYGPIDAPPNDFGPVVEHDFSAGEFCSRCGIVKGVSRMCTT